MMNRKRDMSRLSSNIKQTLHFPNAHAIAIVLSMDHELGAGAQHKKQLQTLH
jgi:hypothetical protein